MPIVMQKRDPYDARHEFFSKASTNKNPTLKLRQFQAKGDTQVPNDHPKLNIHFKHPMGEFFYGFIDFN